MSQENAEVLRAFFAAVWTLRDGKLRRLRIYASKGDALEAVGLAE